MLGAAEEFEMLPGRGVCARIDGKCILEGKAALLLEHGVEMTMPGEAGDYIDRGCTATYVAAEGAGIYYLSKEKHDPESKKIYTVVSVIGGAVAIVCAVLLAVV